MQGREGHRQSRHFTQCNPCALSRPHVNTATQRPNLRVPCRGSTNGTFNPTDRSKSGAMPRAGRDGVFSAEVLADAAAALLRRADDAIPCYRLAVTVRDVNPT